MTAKPNPYKTLTFRVTRQELNLFKKLAADDHLSLSAYIRRLLHKQAEDGQAAA